MRSGIIFLSAILFSGSFTLNAQDTPAKEVRRISISDVFIMAGYSGESYHPTTMSDFNTLAPNSVLLNGDLTGYAPAGSFYMSTNALFSMALGIQFSDKEKKSYKANPLLKLGLSYFSGTSLTSGMYKTEQKPYDTLTSSQTGQVTYIDSVIHRGISMNYSGEQLRFDASLIFRTNPQARWSLHCGAGISAGLSINAQTDIHYNKYGSTQSYGTYPNSSNGYIYNSYFGYAEGQSEVFRNKNNMGFSAYIPMGVDFRISRKNEFWKKIHLFIELRPGINVTSIPELRTITNVCLQDGFGIRVNTN